VGEEHPKDAPEAQGIRRSLEKLGTASIPEPRESGGASLHQLRTVDGTGATPNDTYLGAGMISKAGFRKGSQGVLSQLDYDKRDTIGGGNGKFASPQTQPSRVSLAKKMHVEETAVGKVDITDLKMELKASEEKAKASAEQQKASEEKLKNEKEHLLNELKELRDREHSLETELKQLRDDSKYTEKVLTIEIEHLREQLEQREPVENIAADRESLDRVETFQRRIEILETENKKKDKVIAGMRFRLMLETEAKAECEIKYDEAVAERDGYAEELDHLEKIHGEAMKKLREQDKFSLRSQQEFLEQVNLLVYEVEQLRRQLLAEEEARKKLEEDYEMKLASFLSEGKNSPTRRPSSPCQKLEHSFIIEEELEYENEIKLAEDKEDNKSEVEVIVSENPLKSLKARLKSSPKSGQSSQRSSPRRSSHYRHHRGASVSSTAGVAGPIETPVMETAELEGDSSGDESLFLEDKPNILNYKSDGERSAAIRMASNVLQNLRAQIAIMTRKSKSRTSSRSNSETSSRISRVNSLKESSFARHGMPKNPIVAGNAVIEVMQKSDQSLPFAFDPKSETSLPAQVATPMSFGEDSGGQTWKSWKGAAIAGMTTAGGATNVSAGVATSSWSSKSSKKSIPKGVALSFKDYKIAAVPKEVFDERRTVYALDLSQNKITALPPDIRLLNQLQELNVQDNHLLSLPQDFPPSLVSLNLSENKIRSVPDNMFSSLRGLEQLDLSCNRLHSIPESIADMKQLRVLAMSKNKISELPKSAGRLELLEVCKLRNNSFKALPEGIHRMQSLKILDLQDNLLTDLPKDIGSISLLRELNICGNQIKNFPESIAELKSLRRLNACNNKLTYLPKSISKLLNLEVLDLCRNELKSLPSELGDMHSLRMLKLHSNQLEHLIEEIRMPSLTYLDLADNHLRRLPCSIKNMVSLRKLYLCENRLTSLPEEIGDLRALQVLDAKKNCLESVPLTIATLGRLTELNLDGNEKLKGLPKEIATMKSLKALS